jgi:hypothetical protein
VFGIVILSSDCSLGHAFVLIYLKAENTGEHILCSVKGRDNGGD